MFVSLVLAAVARGDQTINVGPSIAFTPSTVTVAPGETVTWMWLGSPHSSTSNATSGPEFWDSNVQFTGATFSHTFKTPGSYPFYCKVHSSPTGTTMNGVVNVVAPAPTATLTPTATPTTAPTTATPTVGPPSVTPPPTSTPPPTPVGAGAASIPMLGRASALLLAFGLVAAALALLTVRGR